MEPLEQVSEDLPLDAVDVGGEAEIAEDLDPSVLAAQLAESRAENDRTSKRLADTQAWAHQTNQERQQLQAALANAASAPQRQAPPQQQQQPSGPPQLTQEEEEEFLTNPKFAFRKMYELASGAARYAEEQARARYEPIIGQLVQQAQATTAMLPAAMEPAVAAASFQAAQMAENGLGMTKEQFAAALPGGVEMLYNSVRGDTIQFNQLRTNPEAVMHAVVAARMRSGAGIVPAHRPAIPPSAGGSVRTTPAPRRIESTPSVQAIEKKMGVKLSAEDMKYVMTGAR